MGLFALAGPPVAARFGTRGGVVLSVVILIASGILRALVPGAELVLLATFGIGVGTAVIGPIFAMFVRDRMPTQLVGGTSSYAGGTIVGAALGAAFAVPLAAALGGWRGAMLAISVLSIACLVTWILVVRRPAEPERGVGRSAAARTAAPPDPARRRVGDRDPVRAPVVAVLRPDGVARQRLHRARLGARRGGRPAVDRQRREPRGDRAGPGRCAPRAQPAGDAHGGRGVVDVRAAGRRARARAGRAVGASSSASGWG